MGDKARLGGRTSGALPSVIRGEARACSCSVAEGGGVAWAGAVVFDAIAAAV